MLKTLFHIAVICGFILVVAFLAVLLWQHLFGGSPSERSTPPSSTEEAIANYTMWLAILTGLLVLATLTLYVSGESGVSVARQSADAARDAANATRASVELSDRTAESQLRAYVLVRDIRVSIEQNFYLVTISNFGQTPARQVKTLIETGFVLPDTPYPTIDPHKEGSRGVLGAGGLNQAKYPFDPALLADLRAGVTVIKLTGLITYKDIFNKDRTTTFRAQYGARLWSGLGDFMVLTADGNDFN
jgi:hypothetical protein